MNELTQSTIRLQNAQAKLLELDALEREKTLRTSDDCWNHILRFGNAMQSVRISSMIERTLWIEEINHQMNISKELLQAENQ